MGKTEEDYYIMDSSSLGSPTVAPTPFDPLALMNNYGDYEDDYFSSNNDNYQNEYDYSEIEVIEEDEDADRRALQNMNMSMTDMSPNPEEEITDPMALMMNYGDDMEGWI